MKRLKRLLPLMITVLAVSAVAYAQAPATGEALEFAAPSLTEAAAVQSGAPTPAPAPAPASPMGGTLGDILAWLFSATGLVMIAQLLRSLGVPQMMPGWTRPLIGPLLGIGAAALSSVLGFVPDLSILEGVLLGATATVIFDGAKKAGVVKGTGSG